MILLYLFFALVLGLCVIEYEGRISYIILILIMFLLMGFMVTNVDMAAYQRMFDVVEGKNTIATTDIGFGLLMYIAKSFGLSYFDFVRMVTIIGLTLITIVFHKHSICPALVLALYFVFAFSAETIQLRAFLAEGVLYLTIIDIVERGRVNLIHYGITMIIALMLHGSSIFFCLLLILCFVTDRKKLLALVACMCTAMPFINVILSVVPIASVRNKIEIYLMGQRSSISMAAIIYVLLYLLITVFLVYLDNRETDMQWHNNLNMLIKIHYICLLSCVMILVFTSNFYRITRTIIVVDFIVLGNYFITKKLINRNNAIIYAAGLMAFFLVFESVTGGWASIMSNNYIFGSLM